MSLERWVPLQVRKDAAVRLLCFHHAGGSAASFRRWPELAPSWLGVHAIELPGRRARVSESPRRDFHTLVHELSDVLAPLCDRPLALFGHSLGAIIAYEIARVWSVRFAKMQLALFVSGRVAPHQPPRGRQRHTLPDDELFSELGNLGGTPVEVLKHPELRPLLVEPLRADFQLDELYTPAGITTLRADVTAYAGSDDPEAPSSEMEPWRGATSGSFRLHVFQGGHFFIDGHAARVVADISESLEPWYRAHADTARSGSDKTSPELLSNVCARTAELLAEAGRWRSVQFLNAGFAAHTPADRDGNALGRALAERALEGVPLTGRVCLELGCGRGGVLELMMERGARELWGLEIACANIDHCRATLPRRVRLQVGDACEQPYPNGRFDVAVALELWSAVHDAGRVAMECSRVLKNGGQLVVADWFEPGDVPSQRALLEDAGFVLLREVELSEGVRRAQHQRAATVPTQEPKSLAAMHRWLSEFRANLGVDRTSRRYLCWHLEKVSDPTQLRRVPSRPPTLRRTQETPARLIEDVSRCFALGVPRQDDRLQLLALPHAGGRAAAYLEYATLEEERVQWCPLDLPSAESDAPRDIQALVASFGPALVPHLHGRFALLGHSLGGSVAYELACWLEGRGHRPEFLAVIAAHVPDSPIGELLQELLLSCAFEAADISLLLGMLGGTPSNVLGAETLLARALPAITRDFELALRYRRIPVLRLDAPIWTITGDADHITPALQAEGWARCTRSSLTARVVPGAGHFLPKTHGAALRNVLGELLSRFANKAEPRA